MKETIFLEFPAERYSRKQLATYTHQQLLDLANSDDEVERYTADELTAMLNDNDVISDSWFFAAEIETVDASTPSTDELLDITHKFAQLVRYHGAIGNCASLMELFTFNMCSEEGIELAGSTIDKIECDEDDEVTFYYNQNTGDCDDISAFSVDDLVEFYDGLVRALDKK